MYDELIKRLRETSVDFGELDHVSVMMREAADAIEELKQITTHYEEESKGWWLAACDAKGAFFILIFLVFTGDI